LQGVANATELEDETFAFDELELLESEEFLVSFAELLDLISLSEDTTDELDASVSLELADDESSQPVNATPSTPARAQTVNFFANVFFIGKPFEIYSESFTQRTE
jgi:hypothetical protein